jgi:putative two-component system response regulator
MNKPYRILIIDDEPFYIRLLVDLLSDDYLIQIAKSGENALLLLTSSTQPDLIMLDVVMQGMDGYTVCELIKTNPLTSHIPVIFLTAKNEVHDQLQGFKLGACDYILKPISEPILKARVATHLTLAQTRYALAQQNFQLESMVQERTKEITRTQDVAIYCMASLAETRDNETGKHIRRTQFYVRELAQYLRYHPRFKDKIDDNFINLLFKSAPLHDLGKIGVPDAILLKPGALTSEEWEEMKRHVLYGRNAIDAAEKEYGASPFLHIAKDIAYCHHEKWDGNGYPEGLKGDDIPLSARLMAVADCYDALISQRPYKKPFPHMTAVEIILKGRGNHFDPDITDAFEILSEKFRLIANEFSDNGLTKKTESINSAPHVIE